MHIYQPLREKIKNELPLHIRALKLPEDHAAQRRK
jgi:hypothetical protein